MADKTIEIIFNNNVSQQTHVFLKENLMKIEFFRAMLTNSMKESINNKATILFDNKIWFPFIDNLFKNMDTILKTNNLDAIPFSGQFIYQIDKVLDYFLCQNFKIDILTAIKAKKNADLTPIDVVYIILTLYDNEGFQITKQWLAEWFHGLKSLDIFLLLFKELVETVNESEFYTTQQSIHIMQLVNTVRNNISNEMLQNEKLSDSLLMHHEDVEEYLTYEPPSRDTPLYFPVAEINDHRGVINVGKKMITSEDEAKLRFTIMSQGKLTKMPWRNVIVAGGSVNVMLDATLNPGDFQASDIDFFVYGQTTQERLNAVSALLSYFEGLPGGRKFYVVKQSVVSIYIDDCPTSFQIIAGNASTILDVLHHFDMEHLRMAYQDGQFYLTLEAVEALKTKTTYVHGYGTNIYRIWKTINRGYNIVDNGDLILNTDRIDFLFSLTTSIDNPKKIDFKDLKTKFGFDKYKYYIPHKEECFDKIAFEIHLHNRCKPEQVVGTVADVKSRLALEGNFKTQLGQNGYMGNMLEIKSDNIIIKPNLTAGIKYFDIKYQNLNRLGSNKKFITYRTPTCYMTLSNYDNGRIHMNNKNHTMENPMNWTLNFENKDYLKFMQLQEKILIEKIRTNIEFKKWFDSQSSSEKTYLPKINLEYGTLNAKIRPETVGIFLFNDNMPLLKKTEISEFLKTSTKNSRKIKCDIYLDKLCYDFNKTEYFFVYNIKTLRVMEEIPVSTKKNLIASNHDDDL